VHLENKQKTEIFPIFLEENLWGINGMGEKVNIFLKSEHFKMFISMSTFTDYKIIHEISQFSVAGPIVWNSLPDELRDDMDDSCFRRSLKTQFFSQY